MGAVAGALLLTAVRGVAINPSIDPGGQFPQQAIVPQVPKDPRSLQDLLQSAGESMFPADEEPREVTLESVCSMGDTPLHVFLWRGDDLAACCLVAHGANVNAVGEMGETPLHVAARTAAAETIAALLTAGAKIDIVSEFGQTPLQLAAESAGRERIFREAQVLARNRRRVIRPRKRKNTGLSRE
jgi:ankyrin repeat protein